MLKLGCQDNERKRRLSDDSSLQHPPRVSVIHLLGNLPVDTSSSMSCRWLHKGGAWSWNGGDISGRSHGEDFQPSVIFYTMDSPDPYRFALSCSWCSPLLAQRCFVIHLYRTKCWLLTYASLHNDDLKWRMVQDKQSMLIVAFRPRSTCPHCKVSYPWLRTALSQMLLNLAASLQLHTLTGAFSYWTSTKLHSEPESHWHHFLGSNLLDARGYIHKESSG